MNQMPYEIPPSIGPVYTGPVPNPTSAYETIQNQIRRMRETVLDLAVRTPGVWGVDSALHAAEAYEKFLREGAPTKEKEEAK